MKTRLRWEMVSGGDGKGGTVYRMRRMPAYLAAIREYLSVRVDLCHENRRILQLLVNGKSLREIAVTLGLTKPTVHKRIVRQRAMAGITGPGPGR